MGNMEQHPHSRGEYRSVANHPVPPVEAEMSWGTSRTVKSEHNGAKNGGGFHGPRAWAKAISKRVRRRNDKRAIEEESRP